MPLADGATFAGYTIVRMLGSGGMGEVYLAQRAGIIVPAILAVQLLVAVTVAVMEFRRADRPEATAPTTMSPEPVRP